MQVNPAGTAFGSQPYSRENLFFVAVHTARRQQAEQVHRTVCGNRFVDGAGKGRILVEAAVGDGLVDAGYVLKDHTPGTQAHMPHF